MKRITQLVKKINTSRKILLPESHDKRIIQAANVLHDMNIMSVYVLSKNDNYSIDSVRKKLNSGINIIPIQNNHDCVDYGHYLLHNGEVDGMVSGCTYPTKHIVSSAIMNIGLENYSKTLSSFMIIEPPDRGPILFSDCAVVPKPSEDQLIDIVKSTIQSFYKLNIYYTPRIAMLSYSTKGSACSEEIFKIRRVTKHIETTFPNVIIEGEIQADVALVPDIYKLKTSESKIIGDANILIFPNLDAANISYKLVERLTDCKATGPILQGLKKPSNDLSRGCNVTDIVNTALITCLQV